MKDRVLLVFAAILFSFVFWGCKGDEGDRGPTGPGRTQEIYTGSYTTAAFTIDAAAVTADSLVQVAVSTDSINWFNFFGFVVNISSKQIHVDLASNPQYVPGDYQAIVGN